MKSLPLKSHKATVIFMRGHALGGQSPPYYIHINKQTQFFRSAPVSMTEELIMEGEALLQPASPLTPLDKSTETHSFISVEGEVVEISSVKKIQSVKEAIPLKNVTLQNVDYPHNDTTRVALCLWREAAMIELKLGTHIRVFHLKCGKSSYGLQLKSTCYTEIEKLNTSMDVITDAIGVTESETPGMLELLILNNQVVKIEETKWQPFDAELKEGLKIQIKVCDKYVTDIKQVKS
ncbi:uncharacterized protein LOC113157408 isoform X1 [Anabas testudineus]|uniref:uncharacterized protein LOC113157408 isoform X1 n=1 Tax=Anabas testudineus TaxID=64144 RepID=UPI000E458706|nr:uncharacterized protein LOC113157408 isoform X1 [Anabas testudineus]